MTLILVALTAIGTAIMIYGMVADNNVLSILGFVIAMPMTFALLLNLGVRFMAPRQSPPQ